MAETTEFLVKINTEADGKAAKQAEDNIEDVGDAAEKAGKQAKRASFDFKEFGKNAALGATGVLTAIGGFVGFGVKIAGDLESARQGFVALLGSAEEADAVMSRIKEEAIATPFELPGLVKGTQALAAITKDGDKAINMLLDVGKAVAFSGKGQAELDSVILNLQQISSTGKLTAMDIKQFQSAIPVFNEIVEGIGLTTAELQEADNAAELLQLAFEKAGQEGGLTGAGFTAQAGTFNQLISNMGDSWLQFSAAIVTDSGIFDIVKTGIGKITEGIDLALPKIIEFTNWAKNNDEAMALLAGTITGLVIAAVVGLAIAMGPIIIATTAFAVGGAVLGLVLSKLWPVIKVVTQFLMEHKEVLLGLIAFIAVLAIPTIVSMTVAVVTWAVATLTVVIPAIIAMAVAMWPIVLVAGLVAIAVFLLAKAWKSNFLNIRGITESVINFVLGKINSLIDKLNFMIRVYNKVTSALGKEDLNIGELGKFSAISIDKTVSSDEGEPNQSFAPNQSFSPGFDISGLNLNPAFSPAQNQSSVGGQSTIQNFNTTNNLFGDIDTQAMIGDLAYAVNTG